MRRLWLGVSILLMFSLPQLALAVVQPPPEWFDSPEKHEQWQQMWPVLNDWEFGEQEPLLGAPAERLTKIQAHLGQQNGDVAQELAVGVDSPELRKIDLNLDGQVSSLDVLELGYEVRPAAKKASIAPATGTNQWVVLRADFQDENADYATYNVAYFQDRFFSNGTASKPSANDYFKEVSYNALSIAGTVPQQTGGGGDGWYKGQHNKSWYINNGGRWLVYEAVLALDDEVDFSQYDVDGDGYVDTVLLYYPNWAGGGLWPHRSSGLNISVDGVIVDSYFISGYSTSNDSHTMVVAVHEYGHILGWPDLYDIDYSGNGCARWSLMAYNYDDNQRPPSPDPWCKVQLGWVNPIVITDNVNGYSLGCFQDSPLVLKIWKDGIPGDQYFLVANYRKKKTDLPRPGEGLLVQHIDDSIGGGNTDNMNEQRKHVDVESARGYDNPAAASVYDPLDKNQNPTGGDLGHPNDLWFSGNTDSTYTGLFNDDSNPFANAYPHPGPDTYIELSNISVPGDTMTLNIKVESPDRPSCTITSPTAGSTIGGEVAINVTATAATGRTIDRVEFTCGGAFLGNDTSSPYSLTFDSSAIFNGSRDIRVVAYDNQGSADYDKVTVTVSNTAIPIPYSSGFENGIYNWAAYDKGGSQRWEQKSVAYEGVLSAGIGDESTGYDYNEDDSLVSVRLNLTGTTHPIARFKQRYRVSNGENNAKVLVTKDEGATYTTLASFTGSNLSWHPAAVDLVDYVGQQVRLVFLLESSSLNRVSGTGGYWVDKVEVKELSSPPTITGILPANGATVTGITPITVTASDDEAVEAVKFYIDATDLIGTDYATPFTLDWNSDWVFNGSHTLTAKAYDADTQSDSESVSWTVSNPGINIPWGDSFNAQPGPTWRIKDLAGAGIWHRLETGGYDNGPFMRFTIPGLAYHDDNEADLFISPTLDLTGASSPMLHFLHQYDIEQDYDYGRVYVTTNLANWTQLAVYSQTNQSWALVGLPLTSYIGQKVKLAWVFESDGGVVEGGWWLDAVQAAPPPVITGSNPAEAVNGQNVTILGTGFGGGEALAFHGITIGGITPTIVSWDFSAVTVVVPANIASSNVVVTAYGRASSPYLLTIKLPPPVLDDLGQI